MWSFAVESLNAGQTRRYSVSGDSGPVHYDDVVGLWQHDEAFQAFFLRLLADAPLAAYRWETPPITRATAGRPFEFVLLDAPGLARRPDADAFAAEFAAAPDDTAVLSFPNLGGDAVLVVPRPAGSPAAYAHLAAFVRGAPLAQRHALWRAVGAAMAAALGEEPVWLSTAGMGVAWLHVRLDSRPKYYGFRPYVQPG
jgi:hypothetical protein